MDKQTTTQAPPRELAAEAMRQAAGGAAYMKLGDIKGNVSAATPMLMLQCATGQH